MNEKYRHENAVYQEIAPQHTVWPVITTGNLS
jgi:hypothetical protein